MPRAVRTGPPGFATISVEHGRTGNGKGMTITEDAIRTRAEPWSCTDVATVAEDTVSTGQGHWSRAERAIAAAVALAFTVVSTIAGALVTQALSQLF